ncbi:MAG: peptidyl-prolyl cis-trans isomerase [Candidatus Babeliales bacterium]
MITQTRKSFKKTLLQIVLWLTMIAMVIGYLPAILERSMKSTAAVQVNGDEVSFTDFAWRLQHERDRVELLRQRMGPQADMYLSMLGLDNPEKNAYDGLVQDTLMDQAARETHLAVDHGLVARKLIDSQFIINNLLHVIPVEVLDLRTGLINGEALHHYLTQLGLHQADFDRAVERALRASTLMGLVAGSVYIEPNDLQELYERSSLGRKYGIVTLPLESYIKKAEAAGVHDEQLQSFFKAEAARYMQPEKRSGDVWQFAPSAFGIAISDDQAKAQYERVKHTYVESPTQFQIRSITIAKDPKEGITDTIREKAQKVEELAKKDPAQFAQLAKEYSDNKSLASKGGLSSWLTREQLSPEVRKALFALKEDGAVSEIFSTDDGLEIIQRVARKPIQYKSFEEVKPAIVARLERAQFQKAFEREARQIARSGDVQAINQFIAQKGGVKQALQNAERGEEPIIKALFSGKQGDWQTALAGDNGVLVHVTSVVKRHEPALETVKAQVKKDFLAKEAQRLLDADLKKATGLLQEMPIEQVARMLGGSYKETPLMTQESQAEIEKLTAAGVPAERLLGLAGKGSSDAFAQGQHGFIIKVTEVEPFDQAQFEAKNEALTQQLYQEEIARKQRSLVASLYRNATLKLSDQINLQPKA